ncbi:hypothetical protein KKC08_05610 [Patescibacteria group bacterium]|nr:hypothetical protein [Patescibacteria group bacterium]MCG2701534.1 hypothetical protein [Candidatus Parcubacteria bacterium]MBU4210466.1 hypothetical protein [Patescibacteria group bacterium]MBU4265263.1 hypothetical protein [Patescibacteria group bacterium]MBU4389948.1 hypothetical protein [Patescibacteria group bacterium]
MVKKISKQVLEGLGSIGNELGEQLKGEVKKAVGVDEKKDKNSDGGSGIDLFPDLVEMSKGEMNEKQVEDEMKKRQEMAELRQAMGLGRDVEKEMEEVRRKRENEEEDERRREEELKERKKRERAEQMTVVDDETPQHKKRKKRGGAFARGKKPSAEEMTATGEFSKKGE